MADKRFFDNQGPFTLGVLAEKIDAQLLNPSHADITIHDVAALDKAGDGELSFFDNRKYLDQFEKTKATACIVHPKFVEKAPEGVALLVTPLPYKAYALAAQSFYPKDQGTGEISPAAYVADTAEVGAGTTVEAGAAILDGAKIGKNCLICANAVVGKNVEIGDGTQIQYNASVSHCLIGKNVVIYPGARIGQDGFGFAMDLSGHVRVPQLGRVIIEDNVEVGANTTIDRGAGPDTVIGKGVMIDNLVQLGHNVQIGQGSVVIAQAGVAGSAKVGNFVVLAAQSGVAGHIEIGDGAQIGARAGIMANVEAGERLMGAPGVPAKQFFKQVAILQKMATSTKK